MGPVLEQNLIYKLVHTFHSMNEMSHGQIFIMTAVLKKLIILFTLHDPPRQVGPLYAILRNKCARTKSKFRSDRMAGKSRVFKN